MKVLVTNLNKSPREILEMTDLGLRYVTRYMTPEGQMFYSLTPYRNGEVTAVERDKQDKAFLAANGFEFIKHELDTQ